MNLNKLGWNDFFEEEFKLYKDKELVPARVIAKQGNYIVCHEKGAIGAELAGKFRYKATLKKHFPAVGDWVVIQMPDGNENAIIHGVLQRKTSFVRKTPISGGRKIKNGRIVGGSPEEQVIASNIDTAFIVTSFDENFNIQRIERYITLVYNSGANPVIILNKMDICDNVEDYIKKVKEVAIGIPIYSISAANNENIEAIRPYLSAGKTVVFLGSSGVGKSTIINSLLGESRQTTSSISSVTGKGRHTTTRAELIVHDSGFMTIDTPGLRELQLWGDEEALNESFEDIKRIAENCRFNDCLHYKEPGCAVKQALLDGVISQKRYESYMKQVEELNIVNSEQKKINRNLNRIAKVKMISDMRKNY